MVDSEVGATNVQCTALDKILSASVHKGDNCLALHIYLYSVYIYILKQQVQVKPLYFIKECSEI